MVEGVTSSSDSESIEAGSVESIVDYLDVLNSAEQMFSFVSGGMRDQVEYELQGKLTVDIPFTRPLPFSSRGVIDMH